MIVNSDLVHWMTLTNKLKSIKYYHIQWCQRLLLERQQSRQTKPYRGFNSYVAHEPLQEIQIDIADFTRSVKENDGYRYCFVAVDVFTKFCHAVPIKDKKNGWILKGYERGVRCNRNTYSNLPW